MLQANVFREIVRNQTHWKQRVEIDKAYISVYSHFHILSDMMFANSFRASFNYENLYRHL